MTCSLLNVSFCRTICAIIASQTDQILLPSCYFFSISNSFSPFCVSRFNNLLNPPFHRGTRFVMSATSKPSQVGCCTPSSILAQRRRPPPRVVRPAPPTPTPAPTPSPSQSYDAKAKLANLKDKNKDSAEDMARTKSLTLARTRSGYKDSNAEDGEDEDVPASRCRRRRCVPITFGAEYQTPLTLEIRVNYQYSMQKWALLAGAEAAFPHSESSSSTTKEPYHPAADRAEAGRTA